MAKKKPGKGKAKARKAKTRGDRYVEQHGATEPATVFDSGRQMVTGARKKIAVKALERAIGTDPDGREAPWRIQAWEEAEEGYLLLERALGAKGALLGERVPGGGGWENLMNARPIRRLQEWSIACTAARPVIDYAVVSDVLFRRAQLSLKDADRHNRKRDGWAIGHIRRALDLWADMSAEQKRGRRQERQADRRPARPFVASHCECS